MAEDIHIGLVLDFKNWDQLNDIGKMDQLVEAERTIGQMKQDLADMPNMAKTVTNTLGQLENRVENAKNVLGLAEAAPEGSVEREEGLASFRGIADAIKASMEFYAKGGNGRGTLAAMTQNLFGGFSSEVKKNIDSQMPDIMNDIVTSFTRASMRSDGRMPTVRTIVQNMMQNSPAAQRLFAGGPNTISQSEARGILQAMVPLALPHVGLRDYQIIRNPTKVTSNSIVVSDPEDLLPARFRGKYGTLGTATTQKRAQLDTDTETLSRPDVDRIIKAAERNEAFSANAQKAGILRRQSNGRLAIADDVTLGQIEDLGGFLYSDLINRVEGSPSNRISFEDRSAAKRRLLANRMTESSSGRSLEALEFLDDIVENSAFKDAYTARSNAPSVGTEPFKGSRYVREPRRTLEQYEVTKIGLSDLFSGNAPEPSKATGKRQRVMLFESQATRMLGLSGRNNQYTDDVLLVSMGPDNLHETEDDVKARERRAEQIIRYGANIKDGKLVAGTDQDPESDYVYQSYHGTGGDVVMRLIKREAYNRVLEEEAKFAESIGLDTKRNYWKNFLPEGYVAKNVKEERRIEDALSKPWTPTISYGREIMNDANFAVVNLSGTDGNGKSLNFADGVAVVDSKFLPRGTAQARVGLGGKMSAMSTSEMTALKRRMAETLGHIEIDQNGRERFFVPGADGVNEVDITDVNGFFDSTGIKNKQAYTRNGQTVTNDEYNYILTQLAKRYDLASVADFQDYDHASERIGSQMAQFFKLPADLRAKQLEQMSQIIDGVMTEEGQIENVFKQRAAEGDPFAKKIVAGETQLLATDRGRSEVNNYLLSKLKRAASGELIDPEKTGEISDAKIQPFLLDSIIRTAEANGKKPNLSYFAKKFNMSEDEAKDFLMLRSGEVFDFDYLDSDSISMARSPYNYGEGVVAKNRAKEVLSKYGDLSTEEGIRNAKRAFEKDFGQRAEGLMISFEDSAKLGGSDYDGDEVKRAIGRMGKVMADSFLKTDDVISYLEPAFKSTLTQEEFDKLTPEQREARAIRDSIHFTRGVGVPDAIGKRFAWLGSAADEIAKKAALQSAVMYGLNSTSVKDAISAQNTGEMWELFKNYGRPVQTMFSDLSDAFNVEGLSKEDIVEVNGRQLNKKFIGNLQIDKMLPVSAREDAGLLAHMFQVMNYGSPSAASLSADIEDVFEAYDRINPTKEGSIGKYQAFKRDFLKGELLGKYGITPDEVLQQADILTQEVLDAVAAEAGTHEFSTDKDRDDYIEEQLRDLGIYKKSNFADQMRSYGPTAQVLKERFGQDADAIIQGLTTQGTKVLEEAAVKYNNRELPEVKIKIDQPKTETESQDKQEERTKAASKKQEQSNGTYTRDADHFVDGLVANNHKSSSKADQLPSERIQDTKPQQQTPPSPPSPPNNPPSPPSPPNNPPSPPSPPSPPNNPPSDLERLLSSVTMGQTVALQTDLNDYLNQLHDVEGKIRSKTFKTEHPDFQSNVWDYYDRTINESFEVKKREFLQRGASQKDLELLQNERNEIANAYNYGLRVSAVGDIDSFRKELEDDFISSSMLKGDNNYLKQTDAMNKRLDRAKQAYTKLREKVYGTDDDSLRGKELRLKAGFITQDDIDALEAAETHLKSLNEQIEKNDSFNQKNRDIQNRGDILSRISESNQLDTIYNVGSYHERYNASIDQRVQEAGIKRDRYIQNEVAAGRMTEAQGQAYREQHSDEQLRKAIDHQSTMQNVNAAIEPFMSRISRSMTSFVMSSFSKMFQSARQFIQQFDSEMNQIQMISLKTNEEMEPIRAQTIDKAIGLRTSVSNVAGVEAALYRQGLSDSEVASRTDDIIKFSTVTGTKVESATKIITTALQNDLVSSAQEAMDALTALGDSAATTAEEIAKGMQKSAAAAKVAGVSYSELTSMLTVITSKTQLSGQMAGTALQTIFNRMHKVTTTKLTQDTSGETTSLNDVEAALSLAGVSLRADNETFRNTTDVLRDLAKVWQDLNDIQKSNVITAMAGTRQSNMFSTLMEGMAEDGGAEFERLLGLASDSEGITQSKYEVAVTSLNAAIETLKSTFDGLVESFTTSGLAQGAVDFVTNIVSGFTAISEQGHGVVAILEAIAAVLAGIVAQVLVLNAVKTFAIPGLGPILALMAGIGVAGGVLAGTGALNNLFAGNNSISEVELNKHSKQMYTEAQKKRTDKIETLKQKVTDVYDQYKAGNLDINSESVKEAENNIQQLISLLPDLQSEITNAGDAFQNWADISGAVDQNIENAKNNAAEVAALLGVKSAKERYSSYVEELDKYAGSLTGESILNGTDIGGHQGFLDNVITDSNFVSQMSRMYSTGEVPDILNRPVFAEAAMYGGLSQQLAAYMRGENNPDTLQPFTDEEITSFEDQLAKLNEKYGGVDFRKLYEWSYIDSNIPTSEAGQARRYATQLQRILSPSAGQVTEDGSLYPYQIFVDAMSALNKKQSVEGADYLKSLVNAYFEYDNFASDKYSGYGVNDFDSLVNYDPEKSQVKANASELYAELYKDIEKSLPGLATYVDLINSGRNSVTEDYVRDIMTNDAYLGDLVNRYSGGNESVINGLIKQFVKDNEDVNPYDITPELIHSWLVGDYKKDTETGKIDYSGQYEYTDASGNKRTGTAFYNADDTLEAAAENARKNAYIQRAGIKANDASMFKYSWRNDAGEALLGFNSYEKEDIEKAIVEQREVLGQYYNEQIEGLKGETEDVNAETERLTKEKDEQLKKLSEIESQLDTYDKTAVGNHVYKNVENGPGYEANQTTENVIDSLYRSAMSDKDRGFENQYRLMGGYLRRAGTAAELNQLINGTNFPNYQSFFENDKTLLTMINSLNRGEDIYSMDIVRDYIENKLYGGSLSSIVSDVAKTNYSVSQGRYNIGQANTGDQTAQRAIAAALGIDYQTYSSDMIAWNNNYQHQLDQTQRQTQEKMNQIAADFLGTNEFDRMVETAELPDVEDAARIRDEMYAEIEKEEADLLKAEQSLQEAGPTIISPFAQVTGIQPKQSITESSAERAQKTIDKKREEIAKKRKEADEYTQNTQAKLIDYVTEQAQQANVEDAEIEKAIKKATDKRGVFNAQSFYEELGITPVNQADVKALNERLAGSGWTATLEKGQGFQMSYNEADYNPFLQYQNAQKQYTTQDVSGLMRRAMGAGMDWDTLMQNAELFGFSVEDVQQLMNTDVYKYLSLDESQRGSQYGQNLKRSIDLSVSGVSELEEAGKVAEGTLSKIDALKKGGQIALTARLQIQAEGFELDQTLARLNNGTDAERLQTIMNLTGATEQQVLTNRDYWEAEAQNVANGQIEQRRAELEQEINNATGEERYRLIDTARMEGFDVNRLDYSAMSVNAPETFTVGTTARVGAGNVLRTSAYTNANPFFLSDEIYSAAMNMLGGNFNWKNNPELEAAVQSSGYTNLNSVMTMRDKGEQIPEWMMRGAYSELYSARLQELANRGQINANVPGIMQGLLSGSQETREQSRNEILSSLYNASEAQRNMDLLNAITSETDWATQSSTYLNALASTYGWNEQQKQRYSKIGNRQELQDYVAAQTMRANESFAQMFETAGVRIGSTDTIESLTNRLNRGRSFQPNNPIYGSLLELLGTPGVTLENGQLKVDETAGQTATAAAIRLSALNTAATKVYQTQDLSKLQQMRTRMSVARPSGENIDEWMVSNGLFGSVEEYNAFVERNAEVGTKIGEYMAGTAEFSEVLESMKNAQISIEVSGLSELEQAGKIAEGTAQAIENLKKGGSFAVKAKIEVETKAYGDAQNMAKWLYGDEEQKREVAMSVGYSENQWRNNRAAVTAAMNEYTESNLQKQLAAVQTYLDQGTPETIAMARSLANQYGFVINDDFEKMYMANVNAGYRGTFEDFVASQRGKRYSAERGTAPIDIDYNNPFYLATQTFTSDEIATAVQQLYNQGSASFNQNIKRDRMLLNAAYGQNLEHVNERELLKLSLDQDNISEYDKLSEAEREELDRLADLEVRTFALRAREETGETISGASSIFSGLTSESWRERQAGLNQLATGIEDTRTTNALFNTIANARQNGNWSAIGEATWSRMQGQMKWTESQLEFFKDEKNFDKLEEEAQKKLEDFNTGLVELIAEAFDIDPSEFDNWDSIVDQINQNGTEVQKAMADVLTNFFEQIGISIENGGINYQQTPVDWGKSANEAYGYQSKRNSFDILAALSEAASSSNTAEEFMANVAGTAAGFLFENTQEAETARNDFYATSAGGEVAKYLSDAYYNKQILDEAMTQQLNQYDVQSPAYQDFINQLISQGYSVNQETNEVYTPRQINERMFGDFKAGIANIGPYKAMNTAAQFEAGIESWGKIAEDAEVTYDELIKLQEFGKENGFDALTSSSQALSEALQTIQRGGKLSAEQLHAINGELSAKNIENTRRYGTASGKVAQILRDFTSGDTKKKALALGEINNQIANVQNLNYRASTMIKGKDKNGQEIYKSGKELTKEERAAIAGATGVDESVIKGATADQVKQWHDQLVEQASAEYDTVAAELGELAQSALQAKVDSGEMTFEQAMDLVLKVDANGNGKIDVEEAEAMLDSLQEQALKELYSRAGVIGQISLAFQQGLNWIKALFVPEGSANPTPPRPTGGGGGGGGKSAVDKKLQEIQQSLYVSEHEARMAELNLGWQQKYGSTTSNYAALERQKKAQHDLAKSYLDAAKKLKEQLKTVKEGSEDYYKLLKAIEEYLEKAEQANQKAKEVFFQMQEIARKSAEWQQALEHHDVTMLDLQYQRQQKTGTGQEQRQTLFQKQEQESEELDKMREKLKLYEKQYMALSREERDSEYGRELLQKIMQTREEIQSFGTQQEETALQIQATTRAIREQAIQLAGLKTSLIDAQIQTAGQGTSLNALNVLYEKGIEAQRVAAAAQLQYIETLKQQLAETRYGTAAYNELLALLNQAQIGYEQARQAIENYTKAIRDNKIALKQYRADKETNDVNNAGATRQRYDSRVSSTKRKQLIQDEVKQKQQAMTANNEVIAMYEVDMAKGRFGAKNSKEYQDALAVVRQLKSTNAQYATDIDMAQYELMQVDEDRYRGELNKRQFDTEGASYIMSTYEGRASSRDKRNLIAEQMERRQNEITARNNLLQQLIKEQQGYEYGSQDWYSKQDEIDEQRKAIAEAYDANMTDAIKARDYQYNEISNRKDEADYGYSLVSSLRKYFADEITMKDTNSIIAEEIAARNDKLSANDEMMSYLRARMASGEAAVGSDDFNKWMKELQSLEQESINLQTENKDAAKEMFRNAETDLGYDISTEQYDATMVQKFVSRYQQRASSEVVGALLQRNIKENNDLIALYDEGINLSEAYLAKFGKGTAEYQATLKKIQEYQEKKFDLETQNMDLEKKQMENQLLELQQMGQFLQHQLNLLSYQESMYQNRGELTNVNILLGAENSIRQKQVENIAQQREKMEAQLATMDETSAEYNSLRMQILQLDEQEMKLSADIEATTKRMKENEVQVKKYRTAVENIVKSEIDARIQKRKQMRDAEISLENEVLKAFKKAYQDRWDIYKKDLEKQKENLEKQKELIDENLNARKNADDMAEKYAELAQLRYQLSMIETDASRTKDAKELRKKIEDLENEINWTRAENEAELEKTVIDSRIEGIEDTINEGDEDVQEYLSNDNNFAAEVAGVMSLQREDIVRWLEAHDETFANSLATTQDKMAETWTDTTKQWYGIIDTYLEEITEILRSSESFMNYMKESDTYLNGSNAAKFINEYDWSEAYRLMVDSQKDDAEIKWGRDYDGGTASLEDIMDNLNQLLGRYNTQYRFTMDYFDSIVDAYSLDSIGGVDSLWNEIESHLNYLTAFENGVASTIDITKDSTAEQDIAAIKEQLKTMEHYWKYSYVYGDTEFSSGYSYTTKERAKEAAKADAKEIYSAAIEMIKKNDNLSEAEKAQSLTDALATYNAAIKSIELEEEWFQAGSNSREIGDSSSNPYIKYFYVENGEMKAKEMRATEGQKAQYDAGIYGYQFAYGGQDYWSQADYITKQSALDAATKKLQALYEAKATAIEQEYQEKVTKINASGKSEAKKKELTDEARKAADVAINDARIARDQAEKRIKAYNKKNVDAPMTLASNGSSGTALSGGGSSSNSNSDTLDAFTKSIMNSLGTQYTASNVGTISTGNSQALSPVSYGGIDTTSLIPMVIAGKEPVNVSPLIGGSTVGISIEDFAKSLYGTSASKLASSDQPFLRDLYNQAAYAPTVPVQMIDTSNFTNNGFNIESMTVAIHEASFTDDQDYQELAKRVGDEFARELSKRGFNTSNYSF